MEGGENKEAVERREREREREIGKGSEKEDEEMDKEETEGRIRKGRSGIEIEMHRWGTKS